MSRIGIAACYFHADPKRAIFKGKTLLYMEDSLAKWVMSQGDLAYLIPESKNIAAVVNDLDGLVLQGGTDVSPKSYGEEPLKPEWSGDLKRDQYEIQLIKAFVDAGKPVIGVCRGLQIINVSFGGTLYQDITTQEPGARTHRDWEVYDQLFHHLKVEEDSRMTTLYPGVKRPKVNSVHHQGIRKLGKGLKIEARSEEDGIIEAIRLDSSSYVYAVQWHPEFHSSSDKTVLSGTPILKDFLAEAKKKHKRE